MARSIKSKRGKRLRQVLRDRYKKKYDDHLKKIVDKAKQNEIADIATFVCPLVPKKIRKRQDKERQEKEEILKLMGKDCKEEEEEDEEVKMDDDVEESESEEKPKKKRTKYITNNIESLRDRNGAFPCWVTQRQIRKAFIKKKDKKNRKSKKKSLKLF